MGHSSSEEACQNQNNGFDVQISVGHTTDPATALSNFCQDLMRQSPTRPIADRFASGGSDVDSQHKEGTTPASEVAHTRGSGIITDKPTLQRTESQLTLVRTVLSDANSSNDEKLRSAGVLAANGETHLQSPSGQIYNISASRDDRISLSYTDTQGKPVQLAARINPDGSLKEDAGEAHDRSARGERAEPAKKSEDVAALFDPTLSPEEKLRAAQEMAHKGQRRFKGPDGLSYEIATGKYGDKEAITVFMNDGHGHAHPVLRGVIDKQGHVGHERDKHGHGLDYTGDWLKKKQPNNQMLRHDESSGHPSDGDKGDKGRHKDDKQREGDKNKETDKPEDLQRLEEARERLRKAASAESVFSAADRDKFLGDMDKFEARAKTQPLSATEVADTYNQLSRLLEAQDGKVGRPERLLAAKSFAHHMADPTNIDQGQHNTCNVTSLEEHVVTRNPSKAAEMVATMALAGEWKAPDGKTAKIDPGSLVPGREESNHPPFDSERSYATQLMNLAFVNDITQRRMPPMYYSQERPIGQGDLGERLKYADGTAVTRNDILHNGDKQPYRAPSSSCIEISQAGTRLTGDTGFLIANNNLWQSPPPDLVTVSSAAELGKTLTEMSKQGKMPVIINVDINDPILGGSGSPFPASNWHVLSIVGFDEKTGQVKLSNQWGAFYDVTVSVNDLYRATVRNDKPLNPPT